MSATTVPRPKDDRITPISISARGKAQESDTIADIAPVAPIRRSIAWIAIGAIASLLFIFALGRGLTWSR